LFSGDSNTQFNVDLETYTATISKQAEVCAILQHSFNNWDKHYFTWPTIHLNHLTRGFGYTLNLFDQNGAQVSFLTPIIPRIEEVSFKARVFTA